MQSSSCVSYQIFTTCLFGHFNHAFQEFEESIRAQHWRGLGDTIVIKIAVVSNDGFLKKSSKCRCHKVITEGQYY